MNQARIWLVVKPTVGLPLFLGTVALIALLVHAAVLSHVDWWSGYWQGGAKASSPAMVPPAPAAAIPAPAAQAPAAVDAALPVGRLYFAVDQSDKWVDGGESLDAVAAYLKGHDGAKASISGFHDASGNAQHNQELAKSRALVVRDSLVAAGIPAERIVLDKPSETTGSGDPRDARRVEVTIQP